MVNWIGKRVSNFELAESSPKPSQAIWLKGSTCWWKAFSRWQLSSDRPPVGELWWWGCLWSAGWRRAPLITAADDSTCPHHLQMKSVVGLQKIWPFWSGREFTTDARAGSETNFVQKFNFLKRCASTTTMISASRMDGWKVTEMQHYIHTYQRWEKEWYDISPRWLKRMIWAGGCGSREGQLAAEGWTRSDRERPLSLDATIHAIPPCHSQSLLKCWTCWKGSRQRRWCLWRRGLGCSEV